MHNQLSSKVIASISRYAGVEYVSAVRYKSIYGFQFHPEKSQSNGLSLLYSIISNN